MGWLSPLSILQILGVYRAGVSNIFKPQPNFFDDQFACDMGHVPEVSLLFCVIYILCFIVQISCGVFGSRVFELRGRFLYRDDQKFGSFVHCIHISNNVERKERSICSTFTDTDYAGAGFVQCLRAELHLGWLLCCAWHKFCWMVCNHFHLSLKSLLPNTVFYTIEMPEF